MTETANGDAHAAQPAGAPGAVADGKVAAAAEVGHSTVEAAVPGTFCVELWRSVDGPGGIFGCACSVCLAGNSPGRTQQGRVPAPLLGTANCCCRHGCGSASGLLDAFHPGL